MKRSKFTDEEILAIVREGEAGRKIAELVRTHGITAQTCYRWKAKYGGIELSEMQRLKQLEDENRRLKQIVAEQTLDLQALKATTERRSCHGRSRTGRIAAASSSMSSGPASPKKIRSLSVQRPAGGRVPERASVHVDRGRARQDRSVAARWREARWSWPSRLRKSRVSARRRRLRRVPPSYWCSLHHPEYHYEAITV